MALMCGVCGSQNTQALIDREQCITCGAYQRDNEWSAEQLDDTTPEKLEQDEADIMPKPAKPEELPSKPEEYLSKPEELAPYEASAYVPESRPDDFNDTPSDEAHPLPEQENPGPVGIGVAVTDTHHVDERILDAPQLVEGDLDYAASEEPDPDADLTIREQKQVGELTEEEAAQASFDRFRDLVGDGVVTDTDAYDDRPGNDPKAEKDARVTETAKQLGADDEEDRGTGPYEDRTVAQLQATLRHKGLPVSGTHDELVDRLRE